MAKPVEKHVFPNPYGHLDHRGWLAGGCPEAEAPRRSGAMPNLRKIGATFSSIPGTLNDSDEEGRAEGGPLGVKDEKEWRFLAEEPVSILVTPQTSGYYESRNRESNGTPPCLFICAGAGAANIPFQRLAEQRLDAIARWEAHYGKAELPFEKWKEQFPLDADVEQLAAVVAEQRKAAAEKAVAEAKAAADKASTEAADTVGKRKAARDAALAKAIAKLKDAPIVPGGTPPAKPKPIAAPAAKKEG